MHVFYLYPFCTRREFFCRLRLSFLVLSLVVATWLAGTHLAAASPAAVKISISKSVRLVAKSAGVLVY